MTFYISHTHTTPTSTVYGIATTVTVLSMEYPLLERLVSHGPRGGGHEGRNTCAIHVFSDQINLFQYLLPCAPSFSCDTEYSTSRTNQSGYQAPCCHGYELVRPPVPRQIKCWAMTSSMRTCGYLICSTVL